MSQEPQSYRARGTFDIDFGYYVYLPLQYLQTGRKKWPLIIFLHGVGERGNGKSELPLLKSHGMPKLLEQEKDFPFLVVSPQCPKDSFWVVQIEKLDRFVNHIIKTYPVDESRVYLTGLSMGGFGTWFYAMAYPEKFAAIAPICGGGMAWHAESLRNVPVWAFHGKKDPVVPIRNSEEMVDALKKLGGEVRFTVYPEAGHNCWQEAYASHDLYDWFLEHRKHLQKPGA